MIVRFHGCNSTIYNNTRYCTMLSRFHCSNTFYSTTFPQQPDSHIKLQESRSNDIRKTLFCLIKHIQQHKNSRLLVNLHQMLTVHALLSLIERSVYMKRKRERVSKIELYGTTKMWYSL